jgi:nucleoside phosphorylase
MSSMHHASTLARAVILTALPVEYQAVRYYLTNLQEEVHPQGTIYERGLFVSDHYRWEVGLVETRIGTARAAFEAGRAIEYFQPHLVFFVGIAGGLKTVNIGDVVAATKVYGYESGKAGTTFHTRPDVGNSTYRMINRAQAEARKTDWQQRLGTPLPQPLPQVFVAPIAAGEKVVTSTLSATWKFLKHHYEDALAIEMEGFGFLQAVHGNNQLEALIVRGISDLIEEKSAADAAGSQEQAARHASAFAFEVLARMDGPDTPLLSHPQPARDPSSQPMPRIQQKTRSGNNIAQIGGHSTITFNSTHPSKKENHP